MIDWTPPTSNGNLSEALSAQEIDAAVFLPFTLRCLQASDPQSTEAPLSVRIVQRDGSEQTATLIVKWEQDDVPTLPPALQSHIITEWGALGIACAVLHHFGGSLRMTDVAREGDRFDYWVGDDDQEWGLEVSGTESGNLAERHAEKILQLLMNPYRVDGYVIVVRFASREIWFSFHRGSEVSE